MFLNYLLLKGFTGPDIVDNCLKVFESFPTHYINVDYIPVVLLIKLLNFESFNFNIKIKFY